MTLFRLKSHQEFQEYPRGEYSFTYPIKAIGNHIFEMQMVNEQARPVLARVSSSRCHAFFDFCLKDQA